MSSGTSSLVTAPSWRSLKSREVGRNVSSSDTSEEERPNSSGIKSSTLPFSYTHTDRDPARCPTFIISIHFIPRGNMSVSHLTPVSTQPVYISRPSEQFSNGITIISLYLNPLPNVNDAPPIENSIHQIMKEASLLYCLPDNPFFAPGIGHAVQEATYACTLPSHPRVPNRAHQPQQTAVGFSPNTSVTVWARPISRSGTCWTNRTPITPRS